ncbi:glyoxylate reductase/hydroxypyruvate reductase-like [Gigantopelta aegis]|uniref:glyoxylate reductase/hydroxypyruvate reductase-like n=1 Tax=Gigantopelta aegis TaxID=1735272 RepID=UPI001B889658|nr:glyoxylate reductase/hydroxypyruvate reductase-like [Gigantopelta aegis]
MSERSRPLVFNAVLLPREPIRELTEYCDVTPWDSTTTMSQHDVVEAVRRLKPDAIFLSTKIVVDAKLLDAAGPQLKVIGTCSVGLDHVDLDECKRRGVAVGYTPGVLTDSVAENTIGLILATARKYKQGLTAVTDGTWGTRNADLLWMCGSDIKNSTVGIFGLGRIGTRVAKLLQAFGPSRILYNSRTKKDVDGEIRAEYVSFETLVRESDILVATCSMNPENEGLFDISVFEKMKRSAMFINVSRGVLVNQDDLYDALKNDFISAAGLDVTSPEPLPTNHRLLSLANCLIVPHISSATQATICRMIKLTADNILAGLKGEKLPAPAV